MTSAWVGSSPRPESEPIPCVDARKNSANPQARGLGSPRYAALRRGEGADVPGCGRRGEALLAAPSCGPSLRPPSDGRSRRGPPLLPGVVGSWGPPTPLPARCQARTGHAGWGCGRTPPRNTTTETVPPSRRSA